MSLKHGIYVLPGSYANDVIDLLPSSFDVIFISSDVIGMHTVEVLSTTADYSLVAMVTELCRHLTYILRGAWQAPLEL